MALHPAIAACRLAVRRDLPLVPDGKGGAWMPDIADDGCVLVACSGGADSLALLAATIFEAHKADVRVIGAVVDHGLQEGSADHTARVVQQMADLGADETSSIQVSVDPGPQGIEAGAREARYAALGQLAQHFSAEVVLLGHTLDDQAETVLLGLTHGSGPRSLQGMRGGFWDGDPGDGGVRFSRPFLQVSRDQTEAACRADGIEWWTDPHNSDPRFVRSRIRHAVLPVLERELGPGIAETLARTAGLVRDDVAALDEIAETHARELAQEDGLHVHAFDSLPRALATRIIRMAALDAGALASDLTYEHITAVLDLTWAERENRKIQLPGHVTAYREGTSLRFRSTRVES